MPFPKTVDPHDSSADRSDDHIHLMTATSRAAAQMRDLAAALLQRREAILLAWRALGEEAPGGNIASSLSRAQFNDHIPAVLDCLASTLHEWPEEQGEHAMQLESERVCEHGLQRWQQGYLLRELISEWGYLQVAVADELERYGTAHPNLEPGVMPAARRAWVQLCTGGVTQSATQYWRLQQAESAGHVNDLEHALSALHTVEQSRAEAWRTAAHDLRGSVTVVKGAASLLNVTDEGPELRGEVAGILSKSVSSLHEMLTDLLSLARLEAGHEQRELTMFDAGALLRDFCTASESVASERGLFLKMDGPGSLPVSGDKTKVLRILQNLLLNAVKYTQRGGVSVTWGLDSTRDTDRWTFSVQDTGPGIDQNETAPFAQELRNATEAGEEARESSTDRRRDMAPAATLPSASATPPPLQPGEGVGLTIVKRLCELLDASLELATKPGQGSTFRVILPRSYESQTSRVESNVVRLD